MIEEVQARWPQTFRKVTRARCRGQVPAELGPFWLYQWYGMQSGQAVQQKSGHFDWIHVTNAPDADKWYKNQLMTRPHMFCINDNFEVNDTAKFERQMVSLMGFLKEYCRRSGAPAQSGFELPGVSERMGAGLYKKIATLRSLLSRGRPAAVAEEEADSNVTTVVEVTDSWGELHEFPSLRSAVHPSPEIPQ